MIAKYLAFTLAFFMPITLPASDNLNLLPQPKRVEVRNASFTIGKTTKIVLQKKQDHTAAEMLQDEIKSAAGIKTSIMSGGAAGKNIYLRHLAEKDFPV